MKQQLQELYRLTGELSEVKGYLGVMQETITRNAELIEAKLLVLNSINQEMMSLIAEIQRDEAQLMGKK
jgi:hypothetical protein